MTWGPAFGTDEYKEQVETIKMRIEDVFDLGESAIQKTLMMFLMDTSYSRAAISHAEKEWRRNKVQKSL